MSGDSNFILDFLSKLNHPLEEVRTRALKNISNKLERKIISIDDLCSYNEFVSYLLEWFNKDTVSDEELVLKLLKLASATHKGARQLLRVGGIDFLSQLRSHIKYDELRRLLDDVLDNIIKTSPTGQITTTNNDVPCLYVPKVPINQSKLLPVTEHQQTIGYFDNSFASVLNNNTSCQHQTSFEFEQDEAFKLSIHPIIPLTSADKKVLGGSLGTLRSDDYRVVISGIQFFTDVILEDFPAPVFLQRQGACKILIQFLHERQYSLSAAKALFKLCQQLICYIDSCLDPNFFSTKNTFGIIKQDNGGCEEECPWMRDELMDLNYEPNMSMPTQLPVPVFALQIITGCLQQFMSLDTDGNWVEYLQLLYIALRLLRNSLGGDLRRPSLWELWNITEHMSHQFELWSTLLAQYSIVDHRVSNNKQIYLALFTVFWELVYGFYSPEMALKYLPISTKVELSRALLDCTLSLGIGQRLDPLLQYVQLFDQNISKLHLESVKMINAAQSLITFFLHNNEPIKYAEICITAATESLACLEHFYGSRFCKEFVHFFSLICSTEVFVDRQDMFVVCEDILIQLLKSGNVNICKLTFAEIFEIVKSCLSIDELSRPNSGVDRKINFLLRTNIFKSLIIYGLYNNNVTEIQETTSTLFCRIWDSHGLLSTSNWRKVDSLTTEHLVFLQPLADTANRIGRQIMKLSLAVVAVQEDHRSTKEDEQSCLINILPFCYNKKSDVRKLACQQLEQFIRKDRTWDCQVNIRNMSDFLIISNSDNRQDRWFTSRSSSYIKSLDMETENFQKVFDIYLSNNVDISVRKSAAEQLGIFLQMPNMHAYFISHGGLHYILDMIKGKSMDKSQMSILLPSTVLILLRVVQQKSEIRDTLRRDSILIDSLFQMALYFCYDKQCLADLSTILALVIFNSAMKQDKNGFEILLPDILNERLIMPFRCSVYNVLESSPPVSILRDIYATPNPKWCYKESFESNLRIQWNLLKHGGLDNYLSYKYSFVGKKMMCSEDHSNLLDGILESTDRLTLTDNDIYSLSNSIPQIILYDSLQRIDNATNHCQVQTSLVSIQLILVLLQQKTVTVNIHQLFHDHSIWMSSIKKFLLNIPSCSADYSLLELTMDVLENIMTLPLSNESVEPFIAWIIDILTVPNNSLFYCLQKGDQIIGKTDSRRLTLAKNKMELRLPTFFGLMLRYLNLSLCSMSPANCDLHNDVDKFHRVVFAMTLSRLKQYLQAPFDNLSMLLNWVQLTSACLEMKSNSAMPIGHCNLSNGCTLCADLIVKFQENREEGSITFMGTAVIQFLLKILISLICTDDSDIEFGWLRKSPWLLELIGYRSVEIRAMSVALVNKLVEYDQSRTILFQQCTELLPESLWFVALTLFCDNSEAAIVRTEAIAVLNNLCAHIPLNSTLEIVYDENSCHLSDKCMPVFIDHESSTQFIGSEGLYKILLYQNFFRNIGVILTNFYTFPLINSVHMKQSPLYDPEDNIRSLKRHNVQSDVNRTLQQLTIASTKNLSTPLMVSSLMSFLCNLIYYLPTQISSQFSQLRINTLIMNILDPRLLQYYLESANKHHITTSIDIISTFKHAVKLIRLQISMDSTIRDSFLMDEKFMVTLIQLMMVTNSKTELERPRVWLILMEFYNQVTQFQVEIIMLLIGLVVPVPSTNHAQLIITHLTSNVVGVFTSIQAMFLSKNKKSSMAAMQFVSIFASLNFKVSKPNSLILSLESQRLNGSDLLIVEHICELLLTKREKHCGAVTSVKSSSESTVNERVTVHTTLKILLGVSKMAKCYLVKVGFIESALVEIKYLHTKLDQCGQCRTVTHPDKSSPWRSLMKELRSVLELLQNLFYDDINTQNIGISAGFPKTVYQLWTLALIDSELMHSILSCLINFSAGSSRSAKALVNCHQTMSCNDQPLSVASSVSLIDNLCRTTSADVTAYNCRSMTVKLIFRLLANLAWCSEAVNVISRSKFLDKYEQINPNQLQKTTAGIQIQKLWIGLLTSLSFTDEGQTALMKFNGSAIIKILKLQNQIQSFKSSTLLILRNLCTHPVIKVKLVVDGSDLIDSIIQCLDSTDIYTRQLALSSLKALLYSNKKIRAYLKSANVVAKLASLREVFENDPKNGLLPDIIALINVFQETKDFRTK